MHENYEEGSLSFENSHIKKNPKVLNILFFLSSLIRHCDIYISDMGVDKVIEL